MLIPWLNQTIQVQRRTGTARNQLNEPDWGLESNYSVVYPAVPIRIEYVPEQVQWTLQGERVNPNQSQTFIFFEPQWLINIQDRVTFLQSDDPVLINRLYIVIAVFSEWDSMGNTHHRVAQIAVH